MSDISELFARDPLKLTREDISAIIQKMRENRQAFMDGAKLKREVPKTKAEKKPVGPLNLDDLFGS